MVLRRAQWEEKQMAQSEEWLHQGSVLSPVLCNVYTNNKPVHNNTRIFIYADHLCIATQRSSIEQTETVLIEPLHNLKVTTCVQILTKHKNREASRKLNIACYNMYIEHIQPCISENDQ